jgi:ZIP family zinc transporter
MLALLLSFFSGISTIVGFLIIFIKRNNNLLYDACAFASGVMFTVSLFDLIPESYKYLNSYFYPFPLVIIIVIFFILGVLFSILIDKNVPDNNNQVYRVGIISLIAIIIHNIPEGIATFLASSIDINLGLTLAIAIALHNIPEGITIALPIYYATGNKKKAFIYTTIAGLSEFAGALITMLFLKDYISNLFIGLLLSIIAGIMFQISIYELLPEALKGEKRRGVGAFLIGCIIMYISILMI